MALINTAGNGNVRTFKRYKGASFFSGYSLIFSQHSLRQRRELRGDVCPWQSPERGHPAQLRQHLQRGQLLLRDPGHLRPVQRCHRRHIKPEHRGEPATEGRRPVSAFRELIVPNGARASTLERCCPFNLSDKQRGKKGFSLSFSLNRTVFNLFLIGLFMFGPFCPL